LVADRSLGAGIEGQQQVSFFSQARRLAMIDRTHRIGILLIAVAVVALGIAASLDAQTAPTPSAAAPASPIAHAAEWKTYSYPSDGFSVSFPSQPQLKKNFLDTKTGEIEVRTYLAILQPAWVVTVIDYGKQATNADPDTLLQLGKQGALTSSNAHLLSEKKITLNGNHGLEFEAESSIAHFYLRIYLVGGTLYQTMVVSDPSDKSAETARFLDSFQLIARVAN
jgi:hypothetical protein